MRRGPFNYGLRETAKRVSSRRLILDEKPWKFTPYVISAAPTEPGMFALWHDEEIIFIGFAGNLREALTLHNNGSLDKATRAATHYRWEACEQPCDAFKALMQAYYGRHGRYPRLNPPPST